jgi:hypothetical protein
VDVIVENRRQARKVRILFWVIALYCAGMLYWAYDLAQTYGMSPGDGGVLRPAGERGIVSALIAALSVAPLVGMVLYVRRYVIRLSRDADTITVTVLGVLGTRTWTCTRADVSRATEHRGRLTLRTSVNAPWITLRIAGRRYIIDLQSEVVSRGAIMALERGRAG